MSRSDQLRAQLEAEAEVLDLEEALEASKAEPEVCKKCGQKVHQDSSDDQRDLKDRLRAARQRFRDLRDGVAAADGDAVANPATVETTAGVESPGGGS